MRLTDNCTGGFRFLLLVWIIDARVIYENLLVFEGNLA